LRQLDEVCLQAWSKQQWREVSKRLLDDLNGARDWLQQTPANSSHLPGSQAPWEGGAHGLRLTVSRHTLCLWLAAVVIKPGPGRLGLFVLVSKRN